MKKSEFTKFVGMFTESKESRELLFHFGYLWLKLTDKQLDVILELAKEMGLYYELDKTYINGHKYGCITDCPFSKVLQ